MAIPRGRSYRIPQFMGPVRAAPNGGKAVSEIQTVAGEPGERSKPIAGSRRLVTRYSSDALLHLLQALRAAEFKGPMLFASTGDVYGLVPEADLPIRESRLPAHPPAADRGRGSPTGRTSRGYTPATSNPCRTALFS